jgi:hypothetical protein
LRDPSRDHRGAQGPASGPHYAPVHASPLRFALARLAGRGCAGPINGERLERERRIDDVSTLYDQR